jgi:sporulation protein YlmC with PRC-barrel domain
MCIGCSYYKAKHIKTNSDNFSSKYESINKKERYVIIHSGNETWHLSNLKLNKDKKEITASLVPVNENHSLYPLKENEKSRRYKKSKSSKKLEIHFYTNEIITKNTTSEVIIPFSNITKIDVYEPDTGKNILSVLGFTVATIAVIAIIVAATKSSCPFIYIKDGDSFTFAGELYPGAILPTLERNDYIPLQNFTAQNGEYAIKITNELLEIQYTDLAQLVVLNHSQYNEVLLGQNGKPYTLSKKESPKQVNVDNRSIDIKPSLEKDNISYLFDNERYSENQLNNIVLAFDNSNESKQAKLVLSLKNSLWLDLVYGKFNEQFGSYFNQFQKQQRKVPAEKNIQWRNEQGIPLSVFVKSNDEWVLVEKINPVGPMAFRDIVIPVNLENINAPQIEIKLECGFMFWEVDQASIDFSKERPIEMQHINPSSAIDENGKNVTHLLDKEDKNYLIQPNIGNQVVIKYHVNPPKKGEKQSVFLKNRGYYEYIRDYNGIPNFAKLRTFREKGALSKYSKEEYSRFTTIPNLTEIVFNYE